MAFHELELKRIDRAVGELCRRLSPPQHAGEVRVTNEVEGHTVSMYEERPPWRGEGEWTRLGVALLPLRPLARRVAALLDASGPALASLPAGGRDAERSALDSWRWSTPMCTEHLRLSGADQVDRPDSPGCRGRTAAVGLAGRRGPLTG